MSDNVTPDAAVIYVTALASSIIEALPKSRRARAALAVKAHIRDIRAREATQNGVSPAHSEAKRLLEAFFGALADKQAA